MFRTLTRQVTLATALIGAVLVVAAALGLRSLLVSRSASTHLGEHVLAEMAANHRYEISFARAIGEAEAFVRGQDEDDSDEVQAYLADARDALAMLNRLAAEEAADGDGSESGSDPPTSLNQEREALLERAATLFRDLTSDDAARRAQATEAIEALPESLEQLSADAETRQAHVAAGAILAVNEANQGVLISSGTAFGLLVLVLGLAVVLLRWRIIRPLRTLEAATVALADNRFADDMTVTSNDEIGAVQRAFNQMAATIRAQTQHLEQQVASAEAARAEAEAAHVTIQAQLAEIEAQRAAIRDMSVPILPVSPTTLVMPLIGVLDTERLQLMQSQVLGTIERVRARHLLLDITGVSLLDTQAAQGIIQVVRAVRLLGVEVVLVGVRPEVAQTIVGLGLHMGEMVTRSTLQSGIAYTMQSSARNAH
jgi:rsbT co-antagonist protein RsbR